MGRRSDPPRRPPGAAWEPDAGAGAVHGLMSVLVFGALMVVVRARGRLGLPSPGTDDLHRSGGTP